MRRGNSAYSIYILLASLVANISALVLPLSFLQIYDRAIPAQNYTTLFVLGIAIVVAAVIEFTARTALSKLLISSGATYQHDTSRAALSRYLQADLRQAEREATGTHIDRFAAIDKVREFRSGDSATALLDIPFSILFLGFIGFFAPLIAICLLGVVAVTLFASWISSRQSRKTVDRRSELEGRRHSFLLEVLGGMDAIKGLGIGPFMARRYERMKVTGARFNNQLIGTTQLAQGFVGTCVKSAPIVAGCAGAYLYINDQLTVGTLAACTLLASRVVSPILKLDGLLLGNHDARQNEREIKKIFEIEGRPSGIGSIDDFQSLDVLDVKTKPSGRARVGLAGVSLSCKVGEAVGLSGSQSSGRLQILPLIAGDLTPTSGYVRYNNRNVEEMDYWQYRDQVAYLPSRHVLLDGTILDNLCRFNKEKYYDEAIALADEFGVLEYFARHPGGLSAKLQTGVQNGLSRSVLDTVSIIACLLGSPKLILFDNPNENLDADADERLRNYLLRQREHVALVISSNNPAYTNMCDRTYLVDGGLLKPMPALKARKPVRRKALPNNGKVAS